VNGEVLAQSLVFGVLMGGLYALMAAGLSLIFGLMRVVNIGHGAVIVTGAYVSLALLQRFGMDPLVSVVFLVPGFLVLGALAQWGVLRRMGDRDQTLTVLATFAFAIILEGLQGALWTSSFKGIRTDYSLSTLQVLGLRVPVVRLLSASAAVVLLAGLYALLSWTRIGRAIRATTQHPLAAQLVGVNVGFVTTATFAIGIAMAGAAGPLVGMLYSFYPATHWLWIGKLLAVVVLGGLGSLRGALVAALILGIAEQLTTVTLSLDWAPMVFYAFLFGVLVLRPQGMFGTVARESL
jgi:branched-chain amino acid transport system permease protein